MRPTRLLLYLFVCLVSLTIEAKETPEGYYEIDPAIVVNISDGDSIRHVQAIVHVKLNNPEIEEALEYHAGAIRHAMIMLFSEKSVKELSTVAGKENLRKETLSVIQKVLTKVFGEKGITAVYFTSFVIQ